MTNREAPLIAASLFVNPLRFAHHAHTEDLSRLRNEILSFYDRDICCKSRIGRFREHQIVSPRNSFHLAHLYIHNLAFVFLCFGAFRCVSVRFGAARCRGDFLRGNSLRLRMGESSRVTNSLPCVLDFTTAIGISLHGTMLSIYSLCSTI